jgi:hypothetical protein
MNILDEDEAIFNSFLEEIENIKFLKNFGKHKAGVTSDNLKKKYQKMVIKFKN